MSKWITTTKKTVPFLQDKKLKCIKRIAQKKSSDKHEQICFEKNKKELTEKYLCQSQKYKSAKFHFILIVSCACEMWVCVAHVCSPGVRKIYSV